MSTTSILDEETMQLTRPVYEEGISVMTTVSSRSDEINPMTGESLFIHPILRFFTPKEARELRFVCREFLDNVMATTFDDLSCCIGRKDTPLSKSIELWRQSFPSAIAAIVESYSFVRSIPSDGTLRDEDFCHFRGVKSLDISYCKGFTDAAFPHLRGIRHLNMRGYFLDSQISDTALDHLRGIESLVLGSGLDRITAAGLQQLKGITFLRLPHNMHPLIMQLDGSNASEAMRILDENPMWFSVLDHEWSSPLHWASKRGFLPIVLRLLQLGADPTVENCEGDTPLHWACQRNHLPVVVLLLKWGAQPHHTNHEGETPSMWANKARHFKIARYLMKCISF